jgi:hypothetical protein
VYFQAAAAAIVYGLALWLARHRRHFVQFVAGLATMTAAFMALRAVH